MNEWKTILDWVLVSDDTRFLINALKDLGIEIEDNWTKVIVNWWKEKLNCGEIEIYLGQSGTCHEISSSFSLFITILKSYFYRWRKTYGKAFRTFDSIELKQHAE